jgi:hypothetical protein
MGILVSSNFLMMYQLVSLSDDDDDDDVYLMMFLVQSSQLSLNFPKSFFP